MAPAAVPCRISVAASSHSPRPRPKQSTGAGCATYAPPPPDSTTRTLPWKHARSRAHTQANTRTRPSRLDSYRNTLPPASCPPPAGPPAAQVHPPARTGSPTPPTLCHPHARWAPPPSCSWPTHLPLPPTDRHILANNTARVTSQYMACTMTHPRTCHICALPSGPAQPAHPHMLLVLPRQCWHPQEHMPP